MEEKKKKKKSWIYRFIVWIGYRFFPKYKLEGVENLPDESCLIVGNHSQVHGPIACELYMKEKFKIWCAAEVMDKKIFADYAYEAFWWKKPKWIKWFFYLLSRVAPLFCNIFLDAHTLPVYKELRIRTTFTLAGEALDQGYNNVLFAENYNPYNSIVCEFKKGFVDFARSYYLRTNRKLKFVPMYIAPTLKTIYLGKPIEFDPDLSKEEAREVVTHYLMDEITKIATSLPLHKVVPFANTTKKDWKYNLPLIDYTKENNEEKKENDI